MIIGKNMKLIERKDYLDKLISAKGTPDIKVITGIRRSGKSKLLLLYIKYLKKNDDKANIIYIDFNDLKNENLKEYHNLHDFVLKQHQKRKNNYLFIDEVNECKNFEKTINSLHSKEMFDIYITGSNAFLLSSDLATLFTGRTYSIEVFPFSFKEYVKYYKVGKEKYEEAFDRYLIEGGFAGSFLYESLEEKYQYINKEVVETIIRRDIVDRYKIRNQKVLDNLVDYMFDNVSCLLSPNNITDYLNKNREEITNKTISNYINYLSQAFTFYKMNRYDLKGKGYLVTENKFYLADSAMRYARLGTKNLDRGRMIENVVAIELLRRGYTTYVGKLYEKEVDFVVNRWDSKEYIQVCENFTSESTKQREISSLKAIKDNYPKLVLSRTRQPEYDIDGIKVINLVDWLLGFSR